MKPLKRIQMKKRMSKYRGPERCRSQTDKGDPALEGAEDWMN